MRHRRSFGALLSLIVLPGTPPGAASQSSSASAPVIKTVESPGVGVRLTIPVSWVGHDIPSPISSQLIIDCAPPQTSRCNITVQSFVLPQGKTAFTDAERQEADSMEQFPPGWRHLTSKETQLAGRRVYESDFQSPDWDRRRTLYVLAPDAGRMYQFEFNLHHISSEHFDAYAQWVERIVRSLSPVGRPSPEEVESADVASKFSADEKTAAGWVMMLLLTENLCRKTMGRFVSLEEALGGCRGKTDGATAPKVPPENDPRTDPNYTYRLVPAKDSVELWADPRRPGPGGFFSDGTAIYYNPRGQASNRDKQIFQLKLPHAKP